MSTFARKCPWATVMATVMLVMAACKKTPPLTYHTLQLPGFSVVAPSALTFAGDPTTNYRTGKAEWKDGARQVLISWRRGMAMNADDVPVIVRAIGGLAPPSAGQFAADSGPLTVGGMAGFQVALFNDAFRIQFFETACGRRVITLAVAAPAADAAGLWAKLTSALVCSPMFVLEAKLATGSPIATVEPSLFAGWEQIADDSSFIISHDRRMVLVQETAVADVLTPELLQSGVSALVGQLGATWTASKTETHRGPFGRREQLNGELTIDGQAFLATVSLVGCDGQPHGLLLAVLGEKDAATEAELTDLSSKIRCATAADAPLPLAPRQDTAPTPEK